jgi:hypothetical protein
LAPQARASARNRSSALCQPSSWPSVQLRCTWYQQVPVIVATGRMPWLRTSNSSAGVMVASHGARPAAASASRSWTKLGRGPPRRVASHSAPRACAAALATGSPPPPNMSFSQPI